MKMEETEEEAEKERGKIGREWKRSRTGGPGGVDKRIDGSWCRAILSCLQVLQSQGWRPCGPAWG